MSIRINKIDIPASIEMRLKELGMTKVEFAKKMKIKQQNVNRTLGQISKEADKLVLVSTLLDYNFFKDFVPEAELTRNSGQEVGESSSQVHYSSELKAILEELILENASLKKKLLEYEDSKKKEVG